MGFINGRVFAVDQRTPFLSGESGNSLLTGKDAPEQGSPAQDLGVCVTALCWWGHPYVPLASETLSHVLAIGPLCQQDV